MGISQTLSTTDLCAGYGSVDVLKDVNIQVNAGALVTLLGANGAETSTFLRIVTGLIAPTSGRIQFQDTPIDGLAADPVVNHGLIPRVGRSFLN